MNISNQSSLYWAEAYVAHSGGGAVSALKEAGLIDENNPSKDVFNAVIGTSTGAPTAAYFLSGNPEVGTSIYHDECTRWPFFSLTRMLFRHTPAAAVEKLCRVFGGQEGNKALNQERIHASRTKLYTATTNVDTTETELMDAKAFPNIVEALRMSIAIPGFLQPYIHYKGNRYADGTFGCPFPLGQTLKQFPDATDVMVVSNTVEDVGIRKTSWAERFLVSLFVEEPLRSAFFSQHEQYLETLNTMRQDTTRNYLTLWPDRNMSTTHARRPHLVAASRAAEFTLGSALTAAGF